MSPAPARDLSAVREILQGVLDPCSIATGVPISILDMGIVRDIDVAADRVRVVLRLTSPFCYQAGLIGEAIEDKVGAALGLSVKVEIDPTDDWEPEMMAAASRARLREIRPLPTPTVQP